MLSPVVDTQLLNYLGVGGQWEGSVPWAHWLPALLPPLLARATWAPRDTRLCHLSPGSHRLSWASRVGADPWSLQTVGAEQPNRGAWLPQIWGSLIWGRGRLVKAPNSEQIGVCPVSIFILFISIIITSHLPPVHLDEETKCFNCSCRNDAVKAFRTQSTW